MRPLTLALLLVGGGLFAGACGTTPETALQAKPIAAISEVAGRWTGLLHDPRGGQVLALNINADGTWEQMSASAPPVRLTGTLQLVSGQLWPPPPSHWPPGDGNALRGTRTESTDPEKRRRPCHPVHGSRPVRGAGPPVAWCAGGARRGDRRRSEWRASARQPAWPQAATMTQVSRSRRSRGHALRRYSTCAPPAVADSTVISNMALDGSPPLMALTRAWRLSGWSSRR